MISVLTTAYNRENVLGRAIESVLASSYSDFEYIIVDDCSTDNTWEIIKQYAAKDPRIRAYRNEKNLGDYPNRNRAASYATHKYLKYCDSDNFLYPHCLDVMLRCMAQFPDAGLGLAQDYHTIDAPLPVCFSPREAYQQHFLKKGIFGNAPSSAIIKREDFEKLGGFSGRRFIGDVELWFKLAQLSPVVMMPQWLSWEYISKEGEHSSISLLGNSVLRFQVAIEALQGACPLDETERKNAKKYLETILSGYFWVSVRRLKFVEAYQMKNAFGLGFKALFKSFFTLLSSKF